MRGRIREWWRNRRQPDLSVEQDPEPEVVQPTRTVRMMLDPRTPIWDELVRERTLAMRMPTQELRVVFDQLVADWRCTNCEAGNHRDCPACSCPCTTVSAEAAA